MSFRSIALVSGLCALAGCASLFDRGNTYELAPVTVESTEYTIFERVRSENTSVDDPRNDPRATRAVYARVGQGATVYCGTSRVGCEAAILRFNRGQQRGDEMY